jgi:hypothetical protein
MRHLVLGQKIGFERRVHVGLWCVCHISVGQWVRIHPVGDDRHLEVAAALAGCTAVFAEVLIGDER